MRSSSLRRFLMPPGPILSLLLVGVMVLSAILYYRAIKVQRFLEPALALTEPRNELAEKFNTLLASEFGPAGLPGVTFSLGAVIVDRTVLFSEEGTLRDAAGGVLKKLNAVFLKALQDEYTRSHVGIILVGAGYAADGNPVNGLRRQAQERSDLLMDRLMSADQLLAQDFGAYFAATAVPTLRREQADRIEFRIIPSEQLHVEVLEKLMKYAP